ncbi:hypothetical protein Suden_1640 [Sulfurimonas denitrificans DSM 1251]|uniref:Uncharacterized protein n=1 Tax=Sulfurimonas denitrificans (strain ATCC 33889 / DSM 1251) TaxID=326298 RepID=Q30Q14_SULDN|nr:hypothetical protein [Sulfurimonas denitrificans]ABB44917.1 hypothetical protein Suden_1640 [Sulfurimonas denitrificans DSM 1251]MDD3442681.1 hypothetical protein [Sulfurimonas denitrificans]
MKIFLLSILLALSLFSNESKEAIQVEILEKIFQNISLDEKIIIYSDNEKIIQEFNKNANFSTTQECRKASIIVLEDKKNLKDDFCKKAIFVLKYELLKEIPKSFGSMFWKKGRPNIVLIESRIKEQKISISKELEIYIEERIW